MPTSIQVTGAAKYVEFSAGHAIVNGLVLYVNNPYRVNDTELVGAPGGDFGDYIVFLRPNRNVMEAYYSKNWEGRVQGFAPGVTYAPADVTPQAGISYVITDAAVLAATRADEMAIALVQKRLQGSNTVLTAFPLNRGKRLIDTKDISDYAIVPRHISVSATDDFKFPRDVTAIRFVPTVRQTYAASNTTTDRTYDANNTTVHELADTLGTLISDLRSIGLIN